MKKRVLSALVLLPIVFCAINTGGLLFLSILTLSTLIGIFEFYRAFKIDNKLIKYINYIEVLIAFSSLAFLNRHANVYVIIFVLMLAFMLFVMLVYVFTYPNLEISKLAFVFLSQLYILLPLFGFALIGTIIVEHSFYRWLVIVLAFGADTTAMLCGMMFGKRKLVPRLSPAKTVAGAVGSIIGTGVIVLVFAFVFDYFGIKIIDGKTINILLMIFIGMVGSVFAQLGDLTGSAFKRQTGIKDFGNIIPGHGGILDRLDSILFVSVYVYIIIFFKFMI